MAGEERGPAGVVLYQRSIHRRNGGRVETGLLDVADDAHDRHPGALILWNIESPPNPVPDGIGVRPQKAREPFVDDGDPLAGRSIRICDEPAAPERDAERFEIAADHPGPPDQPALSRDRSGARVA